MSRSRSTRSIESGSASGNSAAGSRSTSRPSTAASRAASRSASMSAAPMAPMLAWYSGMNSWPSSSDEGLAQRAHGALVGGHAADEGDGRLDDLALGDGALEVAHHGVAQTAEHLGRLVALLLRVDHVALGEDAAAAGDARGLAGAEHDVAHVLDVVEEPAGLLVHERAGTGGAVAVGLVVDDAGAAGLARLQADELGGLAAHLEDGLRLGMQPGDAARDGLELVLEGRVQRGADEASARARDAGAVDGALWQHGE